MAQVTIEVLHDIFTLLVKCLLTNSRAVASMRQTEAFTSVIFVVFLVIFSFNNLKYLGREFNRGHCLSHNFFLATALNTLIRHYTVYTLLS